MKDQRDWTFSMLSQPNQYTVKYQKFFRPCGATLSTAREY